MFFCFADPHFKKVNHRRRIISTPLLSEYAYILREGGRVYIVTDVLDLFEWERNHLLIHPLFKELPKEEIEADPCIKFMAEDTDEAKKVKVKGGSINYSVFVKRAEMPREEEEAELLKWYS